LLAALAAQWAPLPEAHAQPYPSKPLRLIVPASPGAATDVMARLIAKALGERLGVGVVVDNRSGASGVVGTEVAARAPANGYTLVFTYQDNSILMPILAKKLPYNMQKDFALIAKVADMHFVLVANAKFRATTVKELIALAKKSPSDIKFSSAGNGGINHLIMELFQQNAGVKLMHIPYRGIAAATMGVIAGDVDLLAGGPVGLAKPISTGQVRGLAITKPTRSQLLPAVPTMAESGLSEVTVSAFFGVAAPAGIPEAAANLLSENIVALASAPEFREKVAQMGVEANPAGREGFSRFLANESKRWREVIERASIKLED
jgi:tripartite-type tricarboxylate transporter receptor subunit TctC